MEKAALEAGIKKIKANKKELGAERAKLSTDREQLEVRTRGLEVKRQELDKVEAAQPGLTPCLNERVRPVEKVSEHHETVSSKKEEELEGMLALADRWKDDQPVLETKLDGVVMSRDEAASELKSIRLIKDEQNKAFASKVEKLELQVEKLDRVHQMLLDLDMEDMGPSEEAVEKKEDERKHLNELAKPELRSRRDDLNEVMEGIDLFEEKRPGMKRKNVEVQSGTVSEGQWKRQKREMGWRVRVNDLTLFLRTNMSCPGL
ncbi:hypothetical protein F5Y09DRAFT_336823 [Xylaria sp. FL1042]|nr:hypothetical protein F5Y09DRAFT_336823 [Xylaria sp. FL1042]